jgi:tetratricopeptide (TPR) repeat protein
MAWPLPGFARRFGPTLALGLFGYLEIRAHWPRMRTLFEAALASGRPEDDLVTWAWLEHDRAVPDVEQGHFGPARGRLLRSLGHFETAGHTAGQARCCSSLSHVCERLDQLDEAIEWGERGLKLAHEAGDLAVLGTSHLALGVLYNRVRRSTEATAAFQASFDLAEVAGNDRSLARRLRVAATSYLAIGSHEQGIDHLNMATRLYGGLDDPSGMALVLQQLGQAEFGRRNYPQAERAVQEGLLLIERHNDSYCQAWLLATLAAIQDATERSGAARRTRLQAIGIFEAEGVTAAADDLRKEQLATTPTGGGA